MAKIKKLTKRQLRLTVPVNDKELKNAKLMAMREGVELNQFVRDMLAERFKRWRDGIRAKTSSSVREPVRVDKTHGRTTDGTAKAATSKLRKQGGARLTIDKASSSRSAGAQESGVKDGSTNAGVLQAGS